MKSTPVPPPKFVGLPRVPFGTQLATSPYRLA